MLPEVGERITRRFLGKLGRYQPGWPPLAASTLRKKSRTRAARRARFLVNLLAVDRPLIDTGAMARSTRHWERGYETHTLVDWPMPIHEQDPDMMDMEHTGDFRHIPPRRAALRPAMDEVVLGVGAGPGISLAEEAAARIAARI